MTESLDLSKVALLQLHFPQIDPAVISELLDSCKGSVEETRALITGQPISTAKPKPKRSLHQSTFATADKKKKVLQKSSQKTITLYTADQVEYHLGPYVSLHSKVIPLTIASEALDALEFQKHKITANKFYLFDKKCVSNHRLAYYHRKVEEKDVNTESKEKVFYNGRNSYSEDKQYDETLEKLSRIIEEFMHDKVVQKYPRLPYQSHEQWQANSCVINYYEKLSSNLDWHSDRLNYIGPHNYIVLVSLGSTRYFRVRKNYGESSVIYQIPLPHNSVLVMHPGCQEEYKHCVNAMIKPIQLHESAGSSRFNLTFRFHPYTFVSNLPRCKCDIPMNLRRTYKTVETRGKYFWSCENIYQNKDCGTFHWANFDDYEGKFIADNEEKTSRWIAPEDTEAKSVQ